MNCTVEMCVRQYFLENPLGSVSKCAQQMGISHGTLYAWLRDAHLVLKTVVCDEKEVMQQPKEDRR